MSRKRQYKMEVICHYLVCKVHIVKLFLINRFYFFQLSLFMLSFFMFSEREETRTISKAQKLADNSATVLARLQSLCPSSNCNLRIGRPYQCKRFGGLLQRFASKRKEQSARDSLLALRLFAIQSWLSRLSPQKGKVVTVSCSFYSLKIFKWFQLSRLSETSYFLKTGSKAFLPYHTEYWW